jgi:hypothetical protein
LKVARCFRSDWWGAAKLHQAAHRPVGAYLLSYFANGALVLLPIADVSKGTVSRYVTRARAGIFPPFNICSISDGQRRDGRSSSGGTKSVAASLSVASSDGLHVGPPALFGRGCFGELVALSGDAGARALLTQASLVEASSSELLDVDTAEDLARLRGLL